MRVVFLNPWRPDKGHRDRIRAVAMARWERLFPSWPIHADSGPAGPFNRAAAVNEAARQAGDWDIGVIIDGDVMLDRAQVVAAVKTAERTGKVTWAHRGWAELSQDDTMRILADPSLVMEPRLELSARRSTALSWSCCMAVPRAVWDALGGMDERFRGWGGEDTAFAAAVQGLHGYERIEGVVWNLWHDPRGRQPQTPEYVYNLRLRDRYAYALRRDMRLHDREKPATEGEHLRDLGNIEAAETNHRTRAGRVCYCGACALELGLPDWSHWWPTLEELVTHAEPVPDVALIVHTGGAPETWEARSAYLRAALSSLDERLKLSHWERRVIWSDWGDEFRERLEAIAAEHGAYLPARLTPESRLGYTESMRLMWRYIGHNVKAPWTFQAEDDFALDRDVDVAAMVSQLQARPHLAQLALLREPINERECASETILGHPCSEFTRQETHLEHRRFFTVNPMLMRSSLARSHPWPSGTHSEAVYGRALFADARTKAGIWGQGEAWMRHVGEVRAGGPY